MASIGLFTRSEIKSRAVTGGGGSKALDIPVERLHQMGLRAVAHMNPRARNPNMPPSGARKPLVYVLGDHPDETEDRNGETLVGSPGRLFRRCVPSSALKQTRFGYVVPTLPPLRNNQRLATPTETECFRPTVERDIADARPVVVLGLGLQPLRWTLGPKIGTVEVCRGRRFPVVVGGHRCWYFPVHHPAYVNRIKDERDTGLGDHIPGAEWLRCFEADVRSCYRQALDGLPEPVVEDTSKLFDGVTCYAGGDPVPVVRFLHKLIESKRTSGIDLETNTWRPYAERPKVLSCAVGTYERTIAFAIDHPQARWSKDARRQILEALAAWCRSEHRKPAHNLAFELEWLSHLFGDWVLNVPGWHCTMQQAYSLDERRGGHSLNFLLTQYFGLAIKRMSTGKTSSEWFGLQVTEEKEIDRSKLEHTDLDSVLRYNGLDTKYTDALDARQIDELKRVKLHGFYVRNQLARVPSIVSAQRSGLVTNEAAVSEFKQQTSTAIAKALKPIKAHPAVAEYRRRFGSEFSVTSPRDVTRLLRDVLGRTEGQRGKSYSTDEEALKRMSDEPLAKMILDFRAPFKLKSTYVDPLDKASASSVVWPDGRLHTTFNTTFTNTGRLSSEGPNVQNFPKRTNAIMRKMIGVPPGHVMICSDYGQIEYRVLGMASMDKKIIDSLWHNYDVHMFWTERLLKTREGVNVCRTRYGGIKPEHVKKFRSAVKNQLVFPLFFGSAPGSVANNLDMSERVVRPIVEDEFWRDFAGVKVWQKSQVKFYEKNLYVACLTGRRRRAPMSYNMLINGPIQGTASDLVVDAMNRLRRTAYETGRPWLAPVLNVHDDLTFYVPVKHEESAVETIVRAMVTTPYEWARVVPLSVEISRGFNWFEQTEIGKFQSDEPWNVN